MIRSMRPLGGLVLLCVCFGLAAGPRSAGAQEWARKMFSETSHDFGAVARGAKVEHRFLLENIYEEDAHIASVRSTCGCTAAEVTKHDLKTWDKAEVVATLDTRNFLGQKDSTITVIFDLPFPAEVQLHVHSYIRSDVVVQPGAVQFGSVTQGTAVEKRLSVSYAGRADWRIEKVECSNPHIDVQLSEASRSAGQVSYDLVARLAADAPVGYLRGQIALITNDQNVRAARVPIAVEGVVVSALSVRPSPLMMGVLATGQSVTRKLVVQGQEPFRITSIECKDPRFNFRVDKEDSKSVHLVSVTFTADSEVGQVNSPLRIATDLGDKGHPEAVLQAVIAPAQADRGLTPR